MAKVFFLDGPSELKSLEVRIQDQDAQGIGIVCSRSLPLNLSVRIGDQEGFVRYCVKTPDGQAFRIGIAFPNAEPA
ncbi:MAG: hypothetical protein ABIR70_10445 [Bryobacteraceae bacterium]